MQQFIDSIELSLNTQNWYGALMVTLTLPDIAAKIEYPTENSGGRRYSSWFDRYVGSRYISQIGANRQQHVFMSGTDCYALRCSYLHEGSPEVSGQRIKPVLDSFVFIAPPPSGSLHRNQNGRVLQLQVDRFCQDVIDGVNAWLSDISSDVAKVQALNNFLEVLIIPPGGGLRLGRAINVGGL